MFRFVSFVVLATAMICARIPVDAGQVVLKHGVGGYAGSTDTFINSQDQWVNYGTEQYMELYMYNHNPRRSGLIKFDITGQIPQNAAIDSAVLSLFLYQKVNFTSGDWMYIAPFRIGHHRPWVETQVNWQTRDGSAYWSTPGCEGYQWGDRSEFPDCSPILITHGSPLDYYHFDVTPSVRAWYDGEANNNGWLMRVTSHDGGNDGLRFYTKEYFSGWRPYLTINYSVDDAPPEPNPMTWAIPPAAASTSQISMVATTAVDDTPPVQYYFEETTGNPGGTSSGWLGNTNYSDSDLSANTQYGYRVKARDSVVPPNETQYSNTVLRYTHIPAPTGVQASNVLATSVDLAAQGSFPNLGQGLTGTQFADVGAAWVGQWKLHATADTAAGLTPNTVYTFRVRSRNGDAIETVWSSGQAIVRTLAALPNPMPFNPVGCQSIRANWSPNGNPFGTEYFCEEVVTGKNSGWTTQTSWALFGLSPDTEYEFKVKARNAEGIETNWVDLGKIRPHLSVGMIKSQFGLGDTVRLSNKIVTAVFDREHTFFVEDAPMLGRREGGSGIGAKSPPELGMPSVGQIVDIVGELELNLPPYDKEVIVRSMLVSLSGMPSLLMKPCMGINRGMGGASFGCQDGVYDDIVKAPPKASSGLSAIGMLVTTTGQLKDGGLGGVGFVWIDDGSQIFDGEEAGIRVDLSHIGGMIPVPPESYAVVTGIMRCVMIERPGGGRYNMRVLWPRSHTDVIVYSH